MKKIFPLLFAACIILLGACKSKDQNDNAEAEKQLSPEELVARKIANGDSLSQEDYKIVLNYGNASLKETNAVITSYDGDRKGMQNAIKSLISKYPLTETFFSAITTVDPATLSTENLEQYKALMDLYSETTKVFKNNGGITVREIDEEAVRNAIPADPATQMNAIAPADASSQVTTSSAAQQQNADAAAKAPAK